MKRDRELEKWESWQDKEEEQWGYDHHWSLAQWNWSLLIFKASFSMAQTLLGGANGCVC